MSIFFKNTDEAAATPATTENNAAAADKKKEKESCWHKLKTNAANTVTTGIKTIGSIAGRGVGIAGSVAGIAVLGMDVVPEIANGGLGNLKDGSAIVAKSVGMAGLFASIGKFGKGGVGAGLGSLKSTLMWAGGSYLTTQFAGGAIGGALSDGRNRGPVTTSTDELASNRVIPTFDLDPETGGSVSEIDFE